MRATSRQFPVRLDWRPQIGDLLLGTGNGNGIATGDEAARRRILVGKVMNARASFAGSRNVSPGWPWPCMC